MSKTKKYGDLLRKQRASAGRTLGDVARKLAVSIPYVSDVERGARAPWSAKHTRLVAELFGIEPDELLLAAASSKGAFELDASRVSETKGEVGAALMRGWPEWDEDDLQQLKGTIAQINSKKEKKGMV